ncbi:MAG: carboxylesterase family protein [Oscillospiraceae bacterium]
MNTACLIRHTSRGKVEGLLPLTGETLKWLGIPYAAPPVRKKRWRAPQPYAPWEGVRTAKKLSPVSLQRQGDAVIGSEDCLYLNIYRPNTEENGLPVLFFIHGGNNQTGAGEMMDGDAMAIALNAVVVTINLRLNALGWLTLPVLKRGDSYGDSGNFGLLDILSALNWTAENIAAFGGDPGNITACGFSSGARDLLCMLISPAFRGKFARALTFSGGFTATDPEYGANIAARAIAPLAVADGMACSDEEAAQWLRTDDAAVRDWLYSISGKRLALLMPNAAIRMSVFPHLFADGRLIPKEGFAVLSDGKEGTIPMMCLSGGREFSAHLNNDLLFLKADFSDPEVAREYRFAAKYGGYLFGYINAEQNAKAFSAVPGHAPVYAGRCLWGMDPLVTDEYAAMRMGGTHGLDLYLIMGQECEDYAFSKNVWCDKNRKGREELAEIYRTYIRSFMRTGDPNSPGLPVWERWSGKGCLMRFDAGCQHARVAMTQETICEKAVFEELLQDTSLTSDRKRYLLANVLSGRFFSENLDKFYREHF